MLHVFLLASPQLIELLPHLVLLVAHLLLGLLVLLFGALQSFHFLHQTFAAVLTVSEASFKSLCSLKFSISFLDLLLVAPLNVSLMHVELRDKDPLKGRPLFPNKLFVVAVHQEKLVICFLRRCEWQLANSKSRSRFG